MGVSSLFALSTSLRLLVTASQASSLDDPHVLLSTAQANAAKPAENLAAVHPFVVQDLEDRGLQTAHMLDAIEYVLHPLPTVTLRDEEGEVKRLIFSHLPAESNELCGVMVVRREGPDDVRFNGKAYEHACTLPVVKTPVFARLYDNLVARIGPYPALCQIVKRPGLWQVTAIHNEMLEQAQFASWFKAAKDPKFLEEAAPIGEVKLAHDPIKPVEVAKLYDDFINGVLKLSSSYSGEVGSRTNSIFAKFRAGEHQIACGSIQNEQIKIREALVPYYGATATPEVEDVDVLGLKEKIEDLVFGIWFSYEIDPTVLKEQRLIPGKKWIDEKKPFINRYTAFINKQLKEVSKKRPRKKRPRDVDALNDRKRQRTAY